MSPQNRCEAHLYVERTLHLTSVGLVFVIDFILDAAVTQRVRGAWLDRPFSEIGMVRWQVSLVVVLVILTEAKELTFTDIGPLKPKRWPLA